LILTHITVVTSTSPRNTGNHRLETIVELV